jgi:hypothetical protein
VLRPHNITKGVDYQVKRYMLTTINQLPTINMSTQQDEIKQEIDEKMVDQEDKDMIPIQKWEGWVQKLLQFIDQYSRVFDVIEFLGQIKNKLEDCSRAYTGMWTLDMLHESCKKYRDQLPASVFDDLQQLQNEWNILFEPYREQRKQLICQHCIDMFYQQFSLAEQVVPRSKYLH